MHCTYANEVRNKKWLEFNFEFQCDQFNEKEEIQRVGYKKIEGVTLIYKEFDKQKNGSFNA